MEMIAVLFFPIRSQMLVDDIEGQIGLAADIPLVERLLGLVKGLDPGLEPSNVLGRFVPILDRILLGLADELGPILGVGVFD